MAIAFFLACFPLSARAQQSHSATIVEAWKAQNPQAGKQAAPLSSRQQAVAGNIPPGYQPPPNSAPLGLIQDPLAKPDQLLYQPSLNEGLPTNVQAAYRPQGVFDGREPRHPIGNPRDPFNTGFSPATTPPGMLLPTPYDEMLFDARLNDVFFINPSQGWAVGDRGVIWTTSDGGITWMKQPTPIDCPLRSVHFLNPDFGFAVGGYQIPFTKQGSGVVLITTDGGQRWTLQETPSFPALYKVRILDPMRVWVAGEASELYPSGVIRSNDSGRQWRAMDGGKGEGWTNVDFYD